MSNEHKDTAGNTLRETSSGWEILQKGVGWREFIGMTVLALPDGRIIGTRPAQTMPQDVIDQSQHQKQLEDDLFRHYAGIALPLLIQFAENRDVETEHLDAVQWCAVGSCEQAQEMINELKRRGRL